MSAAASSPRLAAITFDFGNTLVPVDRRALDAVVAALADAMAAEVAVDPAAFLAAWADERARQLREEVPRFREVDLEVRLRRVLARLRGVRVPGRDETWDDAAAAAASTAAEIERGLDVYVRAFVAAIPPDPAIGGLLARLAVRHRLAILSNWPLAVAVDRYVAGAGWAPYLAAVVVSERVGVIKPHPAIFRAAEVALAEAVGAPLAPGAILHVGDDWAADVVGAARAGWRVAYVRDRPADSPLPGSEPDGAVEPDLVLDGVGDLEAAIGTLRRARVPGTTGPVRSALDRRASNRRVREPGRTP